MLKKLDINNLPTIDQEKDNLKFATQYQNASIMILDSLEKSNKNLISKFLSMRKYGGILRDVHTKILKAEAGDAKGLEASIDSWRKNFDKLNETVFKFNPALIDFVKEAQAQPKYKPGELRPHGNEKAMKADEYFAMINEGKPQPKERNAKDPEDKVTRVLVTNKRAIPVRIGAEDEGEKTFRSRMLGFFGWQQKDTQSRNSRERSSLGLGRAGGRGGAIGRGVEGLITGHAIVNLPNIVSAMVIRMFGSLLSKAFTMVLAGLGIIGRLIITRLGVAVVGFATGLVEKAVTKIVEYIFGEDSGITKMIKSFFESDGWKSSMAYGALGAGIGMLFGPAGMFWGFIIGAIAGFLKNWIEEDGPKKMMDGMNKLWETFKDGIDKFASAITTPITDFFKRVENYVKDKLKILGFGKTDEEKKADIIAENKKKIDDAQSAFNGSQDMSKPLWQRNILKDKAKEFAKGVKSEDQIQDEFKAIDQASQDKRKAIENRIAEIREKLGTNLKPGHRKQWEYELGVKQKELEALPKPGTQGLVKPIENGNTIGMYSDMINGKKMAALSAIIPLMSGGNKQSVVNSTTVANSTNNTMTMSLSPFSYEDMRIK